MNSLISISVEVKPSITHDDRICFDSSSERLATYTFGENYCPSYAPEDMSRPEEEGSLRDSSKSSGHSIS